MAKKKGTRVGKPSQSKSKNHQKFTKRKKNKEEEELQVVEVK
jgi:hypothetical protein